MQVPPLAYVNAGYSYLAVIEGPVVAVLVLGRRR